jgi:methylated-DNA-protein-cysteine methyltransferase-like protein
VDARRFRRLVYAMVRRIPRGRVATYGEIAEAIGRPRAARAVGHALASLPAPLARVVPWQRVVNAGGGISRRDPESMALQRELLEREGIRFRRGGGVDLGRARWRRGSRSSLASAATRARDEHAAPAQDVVSSGPSRIRRAR